MAIRFRPLMGLFVTASFTAVLILLRGLVKLHIQPMVTKYFVVILLFFGVVSMGLIILNKKQYNLSGHHGLDIHREGITPGLDFYLSQHAHKLAIYIFGTASIAANMLYLIGDASCVMMFTKEMPPNSTGDVSFDWSLMEFVAPEQPISPTEASTNETNPEEDFYGLADQISRVALTFAQVTFFVFSMPFLCEMLKASGRLRDHWTHSLILVVISSSIGVWLYTYFRETGLMGVQPKEHEKEVIPVFAMACLKHRTVVDAFAASLDHISYPFFMEFALAGLEVLFGVWFLSIDGEEEDDHDPHHREDPNPQQRLEEINVHENVPCLVRCWGWMMNANTLLTALVYGITEAMAIKFFLLNDEYSDEHPTYMARSYLECYMQIPVTVIRILLNQGPALLVTAHCYSIVKTFTVRRPNAPHLNGTYVILGLSTISIILISTFDVVVSCIKFFGSTDESNSVAYFLSVMESLIIMPQFIVQALLLYMAKTFIATNKHYLYKDIEGLINYLAMYNFIRWAISSFLESDFKTHRLDFSPDDDATVELQASWASLVHLCIPPVVYFRYLSTFLLLEVKYLFKVDDEARRRRKENPAPNPEAEGNATHHVEREGQGYHGPQQQEGHHGPQQKEGHHGPQQQEGHHGPQQKEGHHNHSNGQSQVDHHPGQQQNPPQDEAARGADTQYHQVINEDPRDTQPLLLKTRASATYGSASPANMNV